MKMYKATRQDGHSFSTSPSGRIDYAPGIDGAIVRHPEPVHGSEHASHYLSVSVEPGDCTGFSWPARLFEVKAVGKAWTPHSHELPNKRAVIALKIVRELPAHMLFGPQGEACVAIIDRFEKLTGAERSRMYSLRGPSWWTAWQVADGGRAVRAGLGAARRALSGRLGGWRDVGAAYGAALAVLLRHTIGKDGFTQEHYDTLTAPWVSVTGQKAHPEDVVF